jgi:hypothetical protein
MLKYVENYFTSVNGSKIFQFDIGRRIVYNPAILSRQVVLLIRFLITIRYYLV